MSEQSGTGMRTLKRAIEAATGSSPTDDEIIGILKGEKPLDHLVAVVPAKTSLGTLIEIGKISGIEFGRLYQTYCAAIRIEGAATPEELADHPEVKREKVGPVWPPDKPFPLTPLEAWYVMRGWKVTPAAGVTGQQLREELPGKLEGGDGWLQLWQS